MNKRVLFVDEDPGRTGSTVSLEYLVMGFSTKGYDVFVLSCKQDPQTKLAMMSFAQLLNARRWPLNSLALNLHFTNSTPPFTMRGIIIFIKDIIKLLMGLAIVVRAIKSTKVDLVYANEYTVVQASIAAFLCGVPAVMHIRSLMLKGIFGLRRRLVSYLILECNRAIFAITNREADQLCPSEGEKNKIKVIGEFFSETCIHSINVDMCKELFRLPKDKQVVTMLGGIQNIKGTMDFLKAAQLVSSKYHNVTFVIAGKNYQENIDRCAYYEKCMGVVEILKQKGSILMLGEIANSLDLISASDIIVSPSNQTHFSRPVIEAWGFAKPVIAARTEHMRDLITHGVNGLLFDTGDHNDLSRYLCKLLDDLELCKRLGEEGKKKIGIEFNAERNLQRIVDVCDTFINL